MLTSGKDFWMQDSDTVLFVCSGNFYRSRFAEAVFNHLALNRRLAWRAHSRGFSPHLAMADLSPLAREALELRHIPLALTRRKPAKLLPLDFRRADLVICLNEAEHRPLLRRDFSEWSEQVTFWHIPDIDVEPSGSALTTLEQNVLELIEGLAASQSDSEPVIEPSFACEF